MRVELNVFSGRPNPTWSLSAEETAELQRRLADLPACAPAAPPPPLGYRGFVLTGTEATETTECDPADAALSQTVRVFSGVLELRRGDRLEHLRDERQIEEWLVAMARSRGCWPPFAC